MSRWYRGARELEDLDGVEREYGEAAPAEEEEEGGQEGKVAPEGGALQGERVQDSLQPLQQALLGFLHVFAWRSFQNDCRQWDSVEGGCFLCLFVPTLSLQPRGRLSEVGEGGHGGEGEDGRHGHGQPPVQDGPKHQHQAEAKRVKNWVHGGSQAAPWGGHHLTEEHLEVKEAGVNSFEKSIAYALQF